MADLINPAVRTPVEKVPPVVPTLPPMMPERTMPAASYEHDLLKWAVLAINEGAALNDVEMQTEDIEENIRIVSGDWKNLQKSPRQPAYRTTYVQSRIGKNVNDIASALTDFKPIGEVRTQNEDYQDHADTISKLIVAWWYEEDIDLKIQLLVKQALTTRTAYAQLVWNPSLCGGLGDLDLVVRDPRDIFLIRPNSKINIQDAMGVCVRTRNTVNWGRARFPWAADKIQANQEGGQTAQWAAKAKVMSPQLDHLAQQTAKARKQGDFAIPVYDHYELFVSDNSLNGSGSRQWVGPGIPGEHPWGYWVEPDEPLYPHGRMIVLANMNAVLFDGGNPFWHGMFPLIKLTLDPLPWSFLGKSALADAKDDWKAQNEIRQGTFDAIRKTLKPGLIYPKQAISRQIAKDFDSSDFGWKLAVNPSAGNGIKLDEPPQIPEFVLAMLQGYDQQIDHVMGILDMRALSQLQSLGNVDLETLFEHLGPTVKMKGRLLEVFLRDLCTMLIPSFFQFYTVKRRVSILGINGFAFEDFDYDPGNMIPAPGQPGVSQEDLTRTRASRAKEHSQNFQYYIAPGSLLSVAKQQEKLLYLQLFRMSVIDAPTLLEKLDVPNIPKIIERMQEAAQMGYTGAVNAAGRKATAQQPPNLRPDGKISESG